MPVPTMNRSGTSVVVTVLTMFIHPMIAFSQEPRCRRAPQFTCLDAGIAMLRQAQDPSSGDVATKLTFYRESLNCLTLAEAEQKKQGGRNGQDGFSDKKSQEISCAKGIAYAGLGWQDEAKECLSACQSGLSPEEVELKSWADRAEKNLKLQQQLNKAVRIGARIPSVTSYRLTAVRVHDRILGTVISTGDPQAKSQLELHAGEWQITVIAGEKTRTATNPVVCDLSDEEISRSADPVVTLNFGRVNIPTTAEHDDVKIEVVSVEGAKEKACKATLPTKIVQGVDAYLPYGTYTIRVASDKFESADVRFALNDEATEYTRPLELTTKSPHDQTKKPDEVPPPRILRSEVKIVEGEVIPQARMQPWAIELGGELDPGIASQVGGALVGGGEWTTPIGSRDWTGGINLLGRWVHGAKTGRENLGIATGGVFYYAVSDGFALGLTGDLALWWVDKTYVGLKFGPKGVAKLGDIGSGGHFDLWVSANFEPYFNYAGYAPYILSIGGGVAVRFGG